MVEERKHLDELKREIDEIRSALPAHSIPPAMLLKLEDLEKELEERQEEAGDASA